MSIQFASDLFFSDPGEGSISEEIERIDKAIADIDQTIQKADQKGGEQGRTDQKGGEQGRTESNIQGPIL